MAVSIKGKPDKQVSKLKLARQKRGSYKIDATWQVGKAMIKEDSATRATSLDITWKLGIKSKKDPKEVYHKSNEQLKKHTINLDNIKIGKTTYTRDSFYPVNSKRILENVTVSVRGVNEKGNGKAQSETLNFKPPKAPTIGAFTFNTETGTVSTTISTNAGEGLAERYDTYYEVEIYNTRTKKRWINNSNRTTQSTSKTVSYDVADYQQLSYGQFVQITVRAYARGFAGNSELVKKQYVVSYPAQATIGKVNAKGEKCTVFLTTGHTSAHPVDSVKLEYLADVEYAKAERIPASAAWTSTNIVDNKDCTALSIPVGDLIPERGNHTWVRVKSWHANEDVLYRYSNYMEVTDLFEEAPTAADDEIKILSTVAGSDGRSVVVLLGWNVDGQDDSTGTELTWSEEQDTWKSTEEPDEFLFSWSDGALTYDNVTYLDSATITIKGLQEATLYYIKARRYLEDDTITYSNYSEDSCSTSETPESVVAISERFVPIGSALPIRWTFSGYSLQTSWQIVNDGYDVYALTEDQSIVSEKEYYSRSGAGTSADPYVYEIVANPQEEDIASYYEIVIQNGAVIVDGEGSVGFANVPAERLLKFSENNNVTFRVLVSTGGDPVVSEPHMVTVVEPPVLTVDVDDTLTEQPFGFDVTVSELSDLIIIITSNGISGQMPQGVIRQAEGDTVYSDVYLPDWEESQGAFTATVEAPTGLDFLDTGDYTLSVVAVDRTTGLKSEEFVSEFTVDWTNKAVDIDDAVTLTVIDTTDEDGDHTQAVQIDLTPPIGSNETDVYDIYRMDVEHPTLIGEGFPLTYTAVDEYAPFGDSLSLFYRIALRTEDGDVSFDDIEYVAQCKNMRFDWQGGVLELPYGLTMGDSFKKDSVIRQHMDGTSDGYWNTNIERKSSLHSDIIKIIQPRDIERARLLARYAGPVFVRLPDGSAYEADVQVTDLSKKNDAVVSIALDATEIGLTTEFSLPTPYEAEEEEEEQNGLE